MNFSEITNYIISRFKQDDLVNTIELNDNLIVDKKKENIYQLVSVKYIGFVINKETSNLEERYTIHVLQQRDARKVVQSSKQMLDTNFIDNINETRAVCIDFVNYIDRIELDNITIETSEFITLSNYGPANLDGFAFDCTFIIPNTGYCG